MMTNRIYSFMGLAVKAGRLVSGDDTCERALKREKVKLLIIAEDASDNTKKKFTDICSYRNIAFRIFGKKELIGSYTGKDARSVAAILDKGFADRLAEMIDKDHLEFGGEQIGKI
ncbi:MAG: ribosomal L7Ae/L30e/S12e/Gadd45 family protein [Bacillota bacterium]|nr:ribosomal L7Ae/L30e/S12e/Gadd45 family protein [Bacillota bacterium]